MEITVTPKKWYVVSGAAGSTISTPEGVVIATVPDGGQASFYATTYTVEASDDSTEVVEATFKYAPAKLWALGVFGRGETLPSGYLPARFLESTGTQNIQLTDTVDRDTGLMATYQTGEGKRWAYHYCYCTEKPSALAVPFGGDHPDQYYNKWVWCWYRYTFTDLPIPSPSDEYGPDYYTKRLTGAVNWKVSKGAGIQFEGASSQKAKTWYDSFVETYTGLTLCASSYKTFSVKVSQLQNVTRDMVPSIAPTGEPCMFDKVKRQPFYNSGSGSFIVGMTAAQARKLGELPEGGGTLTISLPSDVVDENGVLQDMAIFTALSAAAAKGWSFILQTHDETAVDASVPPGYTRCDFLESTGTQYMDVPVEVNGNDEDELTVITDITFKNKNKRQLMGFGSSGADYWGCNALGQPELGSGYELAVNAYERHTFFFSRQNKKAVLKCLGETVERQHGGSVSGYNYNLFRVGGEVNAYFCSAQLYSCQINENEKLTRKLIPAITNEGLPCMYDQVSGEAKLNAGTGAFICGMTAAQAVQLANLPSGGGELTVSLPQSILNDEGEITDAAVRAALNKAADNGWTITLQYYTEQ